jgi:hypothetical protein
VARVSARVQREAVDSIIDRHSRGLDQIRHADIARVSQQRDLVQIHTQRRFGHRLKTSEGVGNIAPTAAKVKPNH